MWNLPVMSPSPPELTERLRAALAERLNKATPAPAFPGLGAEYRGATYYAATPKAANAKDRLTVAQASGIPEPAYSFINNQVKESAGMTAPSGTAYAKRPSLKNFGAGVATQAAADKTMGGVGHHEDYHEALARVQRTHGPTMRVRAARRAYHSMEPEAQAAGSRLLNSFRPDLAPHHEQHAEEVVAHMVQYANDPVVRQAYHEHADRMGRPDPEIAFGGAVKRGLRQVRSAAAGMRPVHLLLPNHRPAGPLLR